MIHLGVTGWPLEHSFSPAFFQKKIAREGLAGRVEYSKYGTPTRGDFIKLLESGRVDGLNVTIPHKKVALEQAVWADDWAQKAGSANVLSKRSDGSYAAWNTDAPGFLMSLKDRLEEINLALLLGTGGAAMGVKAALQSEKVDCLMVSSSGKGNLDYRNIDKWLLASCDLIVNCTPLGTFPAVNACPDIPYGLLSGREILYDLVYNPSETLFLSRGKEKGCTTINGTQMLINQAELSWRIWCSELNIY